MCFPKEVVSEVTIVGMIVLYADSMRGSVAPKGILSLHSFNGSSRFLEMYVSQPAVMINEDCCDLVSLFSRGILRS